MKLCVGIPAIVLEVKEDTAIVEVNGVKKEVDCLLVSEIKNGDYVIVHAGAIIGKISESEYKELVNLLREMEEAVTY